MELVRVGTFTLLGPGSSITPRSLTPAPQEDELSENLQLRKMSGVLMHVSQHELSLCWSCVPVTQGQVGEADLLQE